MSERIDEHEDVHMLFSILYSRIWVIRWRDNISYQIHVDLSELNETNFLTQIWMRKYRPTKRNSSYLQIHSLRENTRQLQSR